MAGIIARTRLDPEKDIPDLSSKVIIVTGGNNGIGKETVKQLAKHNPKRLYLCARSQSKADVAIAEISKTAPNAKITFLELDLASFASVKKAGETVLSSEDRIDVLINNGGVMALPPNLTKDGYEVQFGTNHMGHALFTRMLMPLLSKTAAQPGSDVRVINLTSASEKYNAIKGGFIPEKCVTMMEEENTLKRYGQSKLANVLFTKELARRYPNITSVAVHPGRVQTPLLDHWINTSGWWPRLMRLSDSIVMVPVEVGALTQLWAATANKDKVKSGAYYPPGCKEGQESAMAKDPKLAEKLWNWQEAEFAKKGFS